MCSLNIFSPERLRVRDLKIARKIVSRTKIFQITPFFKGEPAGVILAQGSARD